MSDIFMTDETAPAEARFRDVLAAGPVPARALWVPPEVRVDLRPVTIEHWRDHPFKKKEKRWDEKQGKEIQPPGCAKCGAGKIRPVHHGRPESANEAGSGSNWAAYQSKKRVWMDLLKELIAAAGLPRGLGRIVVEGEMTFGRRPGAKGPDQDNYRFPLSKALGDALEEGGWLEQDNWLRYEFGGLRYRYSKGEEGFRLMLMPSWDTPGVGEDAPQGALL